jgi:CheY-like chemotaxis protein
MNNNQRTLLLVEDNENDVVFMQRALKKAEVSNPLQIATDGQQAMDYLEGAKHFSDRAKYPLPALMFLDLKLPTSSGLEVLAWLRERPELKTLIVIILSTSKEPSDIRHAFELGANAYLAKPSSFSELTTIMQATNAFWLRFNEFI